MSLSANRSKYFRSPVVKVQVTAEHFKRAKQRDSSHCAIAEAIKEAHPGASAVSVDLQTVRFSDPVKRLRYVYLTPRKAQLALVDFDRGITPEPFAMRLASAHILRMDDPSRPRNQAQQHVLPLNESSAGSDAEPAPNPTPVSHTKGAAKAMPTVSGLAKGSRGRLQVTGKKQATTNDNVPVKVGGRPPPLGQFARRRAFGLRALPR